MQENIDSWLKRNIHTLRVAASYLLVIMIMSVGFSVVFYHTSVRELGRQVPPDSFFGAVRDYNYGGFHAFFQQRIDEGRGDLLHRLIVLNFIVLILGGLLSYYLARRSLEPIESALESQTRFAADASHELRTPLAAIQTENEVALRNPKLTLKQAKDVLMSNLEEVIRLRGLSESLLKLARQDAAITPVAVSLPAVTSEAINACLKAAQAKSIAIKDTVPNIEMLADAAGLTQVLSVLLDNAIKYSQANTSVQISAGQEGKQAWLQIKDEGEGISASDLPHIFERFYRADSSRSKQNVEGNGLGLALAAQIINQLGGEITATSTLGKGSTFTVKLALA